jgi:hypothetical protein
MNMIRITAAALLLAGCQYLPEPTAPVPQSPRIQFDLKCNQFYEIVADLSAQRRRGNIGTSTWHDLNAPIQAANKLCQSDTLPSYGGALDDLEDLLNEIEVE